MIFEIIVIIILLALVLIFFRDSRERRELREFLSSFKVTKTDLKNASKIKKSIQSDLAKLKINENPIQIENFPNTSKLINSNGSILSSLFGNSSLLTSFALTQAGLPQDNPLNQFLSQSAIVETIIGKFTKAIFDSPKPKKEKKVKVKQDQPIFAEWSSL